MNIINYFLISLLIFNSLSLISILFFIFRIYRNVKKNDRDFFDIIGKIKKEKNRLIEKNTQMKEIISMYVEPELKRKCPELSEDYFDDLFIASLLNIFEIISYLSSQVEDIRKKYGDKRLPFKIEKTIKDIYNISRKML